MRNPAPTRDLSRRRGVKADSFRLFLYVLPGILVIHENRGLNPHIEDVARRLYESRVS